MTYAALSDKGMVREKNEDNMRVILNIDNKPVAFIVADGMGGCVAGEIASRLAIECFSNHLEKSIINNPTYSDEDIKLNIKEAIKAANSEVYEYAQREMDGTHMGTTISAAVCVCPDKAIITHIGDSRVYLVRDGSIKKLTTDHSYVGELVRQGILDEKDAMTHPRRNQITRALGYEDNVEVDVFTLDIYDGDLLIFCSDGLHSKVSEDELLNIVQMDIDLGNTCKKLVDMANQRGGEDNITVILAKY